MELSAAGRLRGCFSKPYVSMGCAQDSRRPPVMAAPTDGQRHVSIFTASCCFPLLFSAFRCLSLSFTNRLCAQDSRGRPAWAPLRCSPTSHCPLLLFSAFRCPSLIGLCAQDSRRARTSLAAVDFYNRLQANVT